jgi:ActR/RegA family two-component response regulator
MWGQDEPQILRYAIMLNCSMGADGGHEAMTLDDLNSLIYRRVMERSGGNLSAAARSVGLSRAKLAYRLRTELDV